MAGVFSYLLPLTSYLFTSCSDDFLEVQNPTGEPLEEYYMTDTLPCTGPIGTEQPITTSPATLRSLATTSG